MNLELNVVRFENEDVIATSCYAEMPMHFKVTALCTEIGEGPHNDANGTMYIYYACNNPEHKGKYFLCETREHHCTHGDSVDKIGWYHADLEAPLKLCDGLSDNQICNCEPNIR